MTDVALLCTVFFFAPHLQMACLEYFALLFLESTNTTASNEPEADVGKVSNCRIVTNFLLKWGRTGQNQFEMTDSQGHSYVPYCC